jgi:hypothetical protein
VQFGPEHLDLVAEVLAVRDGLVALSAHLIQMRFELVEVLLDLVPVIAAHTLLGTRLLPVVARPFVAVAGRLAPPVDGG